MVFGHYKCLYDTIAIWTFIYDVKKNRAQNELVTTIINQVQAPMRNSFAYYLGDKEALKRLQDGKNHLNALSLELTKTDFFSQEMVTSIANILNQMNDLTYGEKGVIAAMEKHGRYTTGQYSKMLEYMHKVESVIKLRAESAEGEEKKKFSEIQILYSNTRKLEKDTIIYLNAWFNKDNATYIDGFDKTIVKLKTEFSNNIAFGEKEKTFALENLDAYIEEFKKIVELQKIAQNDIKSMEKLSTELDRIIIALEEEMQISAKKQAIFILVLMLIGVTMVFIISFTLIKGISHRINGLNSFMKDLSEGGGNLTHRLDETGKDEFVQTGKLFNLFMIHLQEMMKTIKNTGEELGNVAMKISQDSQEISHATIKQSDDTSGVSAAMEETTASIISMSDNIETVRKQANDTLSTVESGTKAQQTASDSIHLFISQAKQIETMAETIKAIAFQTNILALNAAVEAARAGDHGRGFAVVAAEVRTLAQRSNESAVEIGKVIQGIEDSIQMVDTSSGEVTKILNRVFTNIRETTRSVNDITNAITEQKQASQSISANIEAIAGSTDKTAQIVNQTNEDTGSLKNLSQKLISMVSQFKT